MRRIIQLHAFTSIILLFLGCSNQEHITTKESELTDNNKKAYQRINTLMGTNFNSMHELQDYMRINAYNKYEGTNFKTFTEVRKDFNKKKGTIFETDQEFREFIAENRY